MNTDPIRNNNCLRGGCARWWGARKAGLNYTECERCGFDKDEDARRKQLPLVYGKDGLQRKIIPAKPAISIDKEIGGESDE